MNPEVSKQPEDNAFFQQRLKHISSLLTLSKCIVFFLFLGILFLILGGVVQSANRQVVEVEQRYDECMWNSTCTVNVHITQDMKAPVYVYYHLQNFYQNVRRYVKSIANTQIRGQNVFSGLANCEPLQKYEAETLYPCGLIANTYFNDTFVGEYCSQSLSNCAAFPNSTWTEEGIAFPTDNDKYKATSVPQTTKSPFGMVLPPISNDHFKLWMRVAITSDFRKLYAIIKKDLKAGDYVKIDILNVFEVKSFHGKKSVILATTSWLGARRDFLSTAYYVMGALCLAFAIASAIKLQFYPRKLGDITYFEVRDLDVLGVIPRKQSTQANPPNKAEYVSTAGSSGEIPLEDNSPGSKTKQQTTTKRSSKS